ncbi:aminotransferase class V-fold PLP-dependent enzyme [Hoeflea sp.]|uniref:aminotransferase class V-fold PLP-dependent enzyme n=1 Tax=Hoeflea sp. TaxID=1940281 RepID=UPI003B0183C1
MSNQSDTPLFFESSHSITALRQGLIGSRAFVDGPFGRRRLIYADYTASGRALAQVENWIRGEVLPYYANSHTEVSECGRRTNWLRRKARAVIAKSVDAGDECSVIFCGSGATAAVNRLGHLLGLDQGMRPADVPRPVVLTGPYEHHSNILPWRERGARTIEIAEAPEGGVDLEALEEALQAHAAQATVVGAFSAASNVTGILTDVAAVTRLLKAYGALAVWDYACAAPYTPMTMQPAPDAEIDALFFSPHKFPGGPGASGVLVVRNKAVKAQKPTWPGGGSVSYVSDWAHDYYNDLVLREEAGTPNIVGDVRAAAVLSLRDQIGTGEIMRIGDGILKRALDSWRKCDRIILLGHQTAPRLPIVSFLIRDANGDIAHHRLVTRLLSDVYGIQAREGCSCAGPYGHRLLDVDHNLSETIRGHIRAGNVLEKPGWTRLNFCHLLDDQTADYIIASVAELSQTLDRWSPHYRADPATANFHHIADQDAAVDGRSVA